MTQEQKDGLIKILQEHLNKVTSLPYENYILAEALYTRTMFLYEKYFKGSVLNNNDLLKVNFKSVNVGTTARAAWEESHGRLLSFSQSMLDELQLPPGNVTTIPAPTAPNQLRILYSAIFLIISSVFLWSFNLISQKRISLYISFQVTFILISALFLTNNKHVRSIEWLGLAIAVATMIISTVT